MRQLSAVLFFIWKKDILKHYISDEIVLDSRSSSRGGTKASPMPSLLSDSNKKPVNGIRSKKDPMNEIHKSEGSDNKKIYLLTTLTSP